MACTEAVYVHLRGGNSWELRNALTFYAVPTSVTQSVWIIFPG